MVDFLWLLKCTLKMILQYSFHLILNESLEGSLKFTPALRDLFACIPSIMSDEKCPFSLPRCPLASSAHPPIFFAGVPSLAPGSSTYQLPWPLRVMASLRGPVSKLVSRLCSFHTAPPPPVKIKYVTIKHQTSAGLTAVTQ